jgi:hypothetical protein
MFVAARKTKTQDCNKIGAPMPAPAEVDRIHQLGKEGTQVGLAHIFPHVVADANQIRKSVHE